jgi:hypothetical protein
VRICRRTARTNAVDRALKTQNRHAAPASRRGNAAVARHGAGCKVISERLFGRAFSKGSRLGPLVGVPFGTYTAADGVKVGIYVLRFAQLQPNGKHYVGPDALRNLYNDPDKNAEIAEFKIDHKASGKKDYAFNLKLDNRATAEPGAHAIKSW